MQLGTNVPTISYEKRRAMEIKINYQEVYTKTTELRQRIQAEIQELEGTYRQANTSLRRMDSKTNGVIIETMESNREKARVTAETLTKLLSFIDSAAQQVEREENAMSRVFTSSGITSTGRRG